jgi:two-component system, chemotaxis family, chemotaxis protein CheY
MPQVLVVDDSPVIRKITRRILESMRFKTSEAADGRQALATCSFSMPDAIFVDSGMPVLDGCDFLRELRQMPGGEKPKIVFCSTEHDVSLIARAMHAGADDFLMKPFDRKTVETKFADLGITENLTTDLPR